ncbi:hypothetical protein A0H81_01284 [Grifola frondosa]|uniref:G-protein coupled receptors family 1 profile domain-containing protein n=1 Tax=Grifola frondosa TaxID=5627 RepID=A0A1C7MQM7_GRIFR|nr:hypothetical protein A0H81_01284 [Grifola frondosa]
MYVGETPSPAAGQDALSDSASATFYSGLGPNFHIPVNVCFALATVGQLLLCLLLGTFLFSRDLRKRSAPLMNLLVVTLASSVPPYLLFYAGEVMNPFPPVGLCATQAVLMNGSGTMFVVSSLALVLDLLWETRTILANVSLSPQLRVFTLVSAPYIIFIIFAICTAALGGTHLDRVKHLPSELACSLQYPAFDAGMKMFAGLVVLTTLSLEIYAVVDTRRTRSDLTGLRRPSVLSLSQTARIIGFTCLQTLFLILCTLNTYVDRTALHVISTTYQATMPLATFFLFAMTQDCLHTWRRWLPLRHALRSTEVPCRADVRVEVTVEKDLGDCVSGPIHIRFV